MSTQLKEQKRKRIRRNYQKELERLQQYCEISIEVLTSSSAPTPDGTVMDNFNGGRIAAFKNVLAQLSGETK